MLSQLAAGQHGQQVAQQRQQKDKDGKPGPGRKTAAKTGDQSVQAQRDGQADRLQTGKGVGAVKSAWVESMQTCKKILRF